MIGFGVGVGDMSSERSGSIDCLDCEDNPLAAGGDLHVGAMLGPRFALIFETWVTAKMLDSSGANTLVQYMAFAAARYWVTPRVWLQGGLGVSHLSLHYDDGVITGDEAIADGGALMGGLGYELRNEPGFTVDLQLKLASSTYDGIDDSVHTGSLGIGLNWY